MNVGSDKQTLLLPLSEIMGSRLGSIDPSRYPDETFELYSIPSYDAGNSEILLGSEIGSAKQILNPGDVLISKIVPHIRRTWVVGASKGYRILGSGEWIVFRDDRVENNYLRLILKSDPFHRKFMSTVSGIGGSLLRARPSSVAAIKIPLPPLDDQKRIAHLLGKVEGLIAQRKQHLQQLDALLKSVFLEMFGDPVKNEKGWEKLALSNGASIQGGYAFKSTDIIDDGEVKLAKISNVHVGNLQWDDVSYLPHQFCDLHREYLLHHGDLLVALTRPVIKSLNAVKMASVRETDLPCLLNQRVGRFRIDSSKMNVMFIREFCSTQYFKSEINKLCSQALQPNVSTSQIEAIVTIFPPLHIQSKFSAIVEKLEGIKGGYQQSLTDLEALYGALSQKAFAGELDLSRVNL